MPSTPLSYKISEHARQAWRVNDSEVLSFPGYGCDMRIEKHNGRLYLQGRPSLSALFESETEDEWCEVENLEGQPSDTHTSCDFVREINAAFRTQFQCADAGWDCIIDNPNIVNTYPCIVRG